MRFKLIVAFVEPNRTEELLTEARRAGATGATVINTARGEGRTPLRGVLGLEIAARRDVLLLLVEESRARSVLERLADVGELDESPGSGIALQLDVEDALGVRHQMIDLVRGMSNDSTGDS